MAQDEFDVCSKALGLIGEEPITSFDDDTHASEQCGLHYDLFVRSMMTMKDWYFLRTRADLVEDGATIPINEWTRAFSLPSDRLGPPLEVFASSASGAKPITEGWELHGNHIYTDLTSLTIKYAAQKAESLWPPYFEQLVVWGLAAELCTPITENGAQAERLHAKAYGTPGADGRGGLFAVASQADETGRPTETLLDDSDPMTEARFGGYGGGGYY